MTSLDISELVKSRHDKVKRSIDRLSSDNEHRPAIIQRPPLGEVKNHLGQSVSVYLISKRDSYVIVAQLSPEFTAALVDRWQELENQTEKNQILVPDFSNPAEAARAWATQYEAAQLAIATKAEIGSRREATAMNTASQAVKQVNKLEIELDRSKQFSSVKRMEMLYHGQKFNWRELKTTCSLMGLAPIDIFDANYGTVKAWPAEVWREVYALEIL